MLTSTKVTGIAYQVDEKTHKYVLDKIGRLDRFLPRHARKSASAEVRLKQVKGGAGNKYEAEVSLDVPEKTILAKNVGTHMFAAVDAAEAKLVTQLRKYKQTTLAHVGRRRVLSHFKRSYAREL